jgi:hypothetical protein
MKHHHGRGRWRAILLIAFLLVPVLLMGGGALVLGVLLADVHDAYLKDIVDAGKEPAFLLTLAFLLTFGTVRLITYSIRDQKLRIFHNVTTRSGLHIHHMVPGLVLAIVSGYLGIVLSVWRPTSLLAIVFGIGVALVLDEFAIFLRLADVYWEPEGRESIDAVVLAGGVSVLYLLGLDFWPHLVQALVGRLFGLL